MKTLPQIVSPPFWYSLFWTVVFLPCFGVTVYWSVRWAVTAAFRVCRPELETMIRAALAAALNGK